jgi:oligosaccharide repeat unit polymerase
MLTFITALFLIISLVLSGIFYRKYFLNPIVVFFAIWLFSLLLYELDAHFKFFYVRLSSKAEIIFFISFFAFFIGSLTVALPLRNKEKNRTQPGIEDRQLGFLYKIVKITFFVFLGAVFCKYILLFQRYGNPFANLALIRMESSGKFCFPLILRFLSLSGYLLILNLGILIVLHCNKKIVFLTLASLILSFLNAASIGGRGSAFLTALFFITTVLVALIIKYKKIKIRFLLMGIAGILICVLSLTTVVYLRNDGKIAFMNRVIADNYLYIVGPIPATSFFIQEPWPSRLAGYNTMAGMYQLLDIASVSLFKINLLVPQDLQSSFAKITNIGPFNTSSYITYFYSDFKEAGVVIFSYLLGLITTYLFFRAIFYRRIIDIQLLAIAMTNLLLSPRGILTNGINFWVILAVLIIQHRILTKPARITSR